MATAVCYAGSVCHIVRLWSVEHSSSWSGVFPLGLKDSIPRAYPRAYWKTGILSRATDFEEEQSHTSLLTSCKIGHDNCDMYL